MSGNGNHKITVGARTYTILLCSRGRELRDEWTALLERGADRDEIYLAMRDYFTHKNGVHSRSGKMVIAPCPNCRMIAGGSVELFERSRDGNSG